MISPPVLGKGEIEYTSLDIRHDHKPWSPELFVKSMSTFTWTRYFFKGDFSTGNYKTLDIWRRGNSSFWKSSGQLTASSWITARSPGKVTIGDAAIPTVWPGDSSVSGTTNPGEGAPSNPGSTSGAAPANPAVRSPLRALPSANRFFFTICQTLGLPIFLLHSYRPCPWLGPRTPKRKPNRPWKSCLLISPLRQRERKSEAPSIPPVCIRV